MCKFVVSTQTPECLKSRETRLFLQHFDEANDEENMKAPHHFSLFHVPNGFAY